MPYGEGQAYNQEEFTRMFEEKQGYDNGGVQNEQGDLGQLLIMLLMNMLGGGGQGGQMMGQAPMQPPAMAPGGLRGPVPPAMARPQLPQGPIQGPPNPLQSPLGARSGLPMGPTPGGMPRGMPPAIPQGPQMMPQGGRGNPLQALMGLLGGGR